MNSRERIRKTLSHSQPDKLPVDFGGMLGTGINVSVIYQLRQRLGLDKAGTPVKVIEPFQMLGEIKDDLKSILGIDTAALLGEKNFFGFENTGWKEWELWDNTPILIPEKFNTRKEKDGSVVQYPEGDTSAMPSGKMPEKGYYFDAIIRQKPIVEEELKVEDNLEEFKIISETELSKIKSEAEELFFNSDYSIFASLVQSGFGDISLIPGVQIKNPHGIRDITEWYIS
ncbi:MAG: methyltransferase, partial [Actinobacteria bacterium]|nr:methyltransferase [Actinomycetota bacterium]